MKNLKLYSGITAFLLLVNGYSLSKADGITFVFGDNGIENAAITEETIKPLEPIYVYGNVLSTVDDFSYYKLFYISPDVNEDNIVEVLQTMHNNFLLIEKYYSEDINKMIKFETYTYSVDIELFKKEIVEVEEYFINYGERDLIRIFNGLYNGYIGYIDTFARVMTEHYHKVLSPVVPGETPKYIEDKINESNLLLELISNDSRFDKKFIKNYTKAYDLFINNLSKCKNKTNKEIIEFMKKSYNDLDNYYQEICNTMITEEKVK